MENLMDHFPLKEGVEAQSKGAWISLMEERGSMSQKSQRAYRLYSLCYPLLAFLAYKGVWRGKLLKHIHFFRESSRKCGRIVDLATGDGTLTKKALFPFWGEKPEAVLALDISTSMLRQAAKKLPAKKSLFVQGDVMDLPFEPRSLSCVTCFGGFNSFASGKLAMKEICRVLDKKGILRGSVLLTPKSKWKRFCVDRFIQWGLQTEHVSEEDFFSWVDGAGLHCSILERHGDVLLFEVSPWAQ